jgi:hypothetical protein
MHGRDVFTVQTTERIHLTNAERHAFFIQQLSRKLTEEQLRELFIAARDNIGYGERRNPAPALSSQQQLLCDWLCADGYAEAADERLRAERDVAVAKLNANEHGDYDARTLAADLKRAAAGLREFRSQIDRQFQALEKALDKVPLPESRY